MTWRKHSSWILEKEHPQPHHTIASCQEEVCLPGGNQPGAWGSGWPSWCTCALYLDKLTSATKFSQALSWASSCCCSFSLALLSKNILSARQKKRKLEKLWWKVNGTEDQVIKVHLSEQRWPGVLLVESPGVTDGTVSPTPPLNSYVEALTPWWLYLKIGPLKW